MTEHPNLLKRRIKTLYGKPGVGFRNGDFHTTAGARDMALATIEAMLDRTIDHLKSVMGDLYEKTYGE